MPASWDGPLQARSRDASGRLSSRRAAAGASYASSPWSSGSSGRCRWCGTARRSSPAAPSSGRCSWTCSSTTARWSRGIGSSRTSGPAARPPPASACSRTTSPSSARRWGRTRSSPAARATPSTSTPPPSTASGSRRLVDEARAALRGRRPAGAVDSCASAGAVAGPGAGRRGRGALRPGGDRPAGRAAGGRRGTELEAELAAGRHREVVGRVEALLAEHPLRERLWWLLMLALYRSGRQADALRAYQRPGPPPGGAGHRPRRRAAGPRSGHPPAGPGPRRLLAPAPHRWRRPPRRPAPCAPSPDPRPRPARALVGRADERARARRLPRRRPGRGQGGLLLLVGRAGHRQDPAPRGGPGPRPGRRRGAPSGGAYEAERGRPYGAWVDALRSMPLAALAERLRADLTPLLPELSGSGSTSTIPAASTTRRRRCCPAGRRRHRWPCSSTTSTGSTSRRRRCCTSPSATWPTGGVAFVATARSAELEDNVACRRVVAGPAARRPARRPARRAAPGRDHRRPDPADRARCRPDRDRRRQQRQPAAGAGDGPGPGPGRRAAVQPARRPHR